MAKTKNENNFDNVVAFKKRRFKQKKYHSESLLELEQFIKNFKEVECQGFIAFAIGKDEEIIAHHSFNVKNLRLYSLIGMLESRKRYLLDLAEQIDEECE